MKTKILPLALMASALMLSACGGDGILGSDDDIAPLRPEAGTIDPTDRPRPPEGEPTLTTNEQFVLDVASDRVMLRGVTLDYASSPSDMIEAIEPLATDGSNAVRLMVNAETTATELEGALSVVAENNMVAVITLTDDDQIRCVESPDALLSAADELWLGEWLEVLAQDRFQGRVIINIADGWGPNNIFNSASLGYAEYIDTYKALIRRFRDAGFKLPLMIDAPNCGQDYNAFLVGRGRELLAADSEANLILAANGEGFRWDSADKIIAANTLIAGERVPFVMNAFAGSEIGEFPVNHMDIMAQAQGNSAVSVNTPWSTAEDAVGYTIAFGEALDLTGGAISLEVLMDRRYLEFMRVAPGSSNYAPTGSTGIAVYLTDENGDRLRLGLEEARTLRENSWNTIRFDVPEEIDPANFMNGSDSFDRMAVTHAGVEILANGKAASAEGEIRFDNLNIFPGVPPMYTAGFDSDQEGWAANNATVGVTDGSLSLLPTDAQVDLVLVGPSGIDFSKTFNVTITMFLPEEYSSDSLWMQSFGQFGEGWSWNAVSVNPASLVPGEWSELEYTVNFNETVDPPSDISVAQAFGLQIGGITTPKNDPILIDSIVIEDPLARPTRTVTSTQYRATFSSGVEGFQAETGWGSQATVSMDSEELVIVMPEGDEGAINKANINSVAEVNFGGDLTVKARVFLPESFAESEFWMSFFFQDGSWSHFAIGDINLEEFSFGEWNDVEFSITDADYPEDFARTLSPNMFGFQYSGAPGGEVRLDDVEIIGDTEVDDLQPIYQAGFSSQGEVDALEVDFTRGALDSGSMLDAKSLGWHVVPFGWLASTWYTEDEEWAPLSIAVDPAGSALTERGEEIVNGVDGLSETAEPISFE